MSPPKEAVAENSPAAEAVTVQVYTLWFEPIPASGPVCVKHEKGLADPPEAVYEAAQVTSPAGACAPATPLTCAVNVIVSPRFGLEGEADAVIVAVEALTTAVSEPGYVNDP